MFDFEDIFLGTGALNQFEYDDEGQTITRGGLPMEGAMFPTEREKRSMPEMPGPIGPRGIAPEGSTIDPVGGITKRAFHKYNVPGPVDKMGIAPAGSEIKVDNKLLPNLYDTKPEGTGLSNKQLAPQFPGDKPNLLSSVARGVSLAAPLGIGIANMINQKRDQINPKLQDVSLATNVVRSLRSPRITTKFRRATGSSLAEREAGLRFQDAQNMDRQQRYDVMNDQFIQRQKQQNTAIKNREAMMNNQTRNRQEMMQTQLANQRLTNQQNMANKMFGDFAFNLADFANQKTSVAANRKARLIEAAIASGKYDGPQIQELIKNY